MKVSVAVASAKSIATAPAEPIGVASVFRTGSGIHHSDVDGFRSAPKVHSTIGPRHVWLREKPEFGKVEFREAFDTMKKWLLAGFMSALTVCYATTSASAQSA